MLFGANQRLARSQKPFLSSSGTLLELAETVKYLGLSLHATLNWHDHIDVVASEVPRRLNLLGRIQKYLRVNTCKHLHGTLIQPLYEYCDVIWSNTDKTSLDRLLRLQKRGAGIIPQKIREERTEHIFRELGWVSLVEQ